MLRLKAVRQFKKDMKKYQHQTDVIAALDEIISCLLSGKKLPIHCRDHALIGEYIGMRECHIRPDALLVYWVNEQMDTLYLERIGSHSELF